MQKVYFPSGLLNSDGIMDLAVEYKTLIATAMVHREMSACGVIRLTDYTLSTLGFLSGDGKSAALELHRRGQAVFDEQTREFFVLGFFRTNQTPSQAGAGSPWAKLVQISLDRIKSQEVKGAAMADIAAGDQAGVKFESVGVPTNLLSALPRVKFGTKWQKSERLLLLALYCDQTGHAPGLPVVDFDNLGQLCSLPPMTVAECCETLTHAEAITFDKDTGEACVFARIKNATTAELDQIDAALPEIKSTQVKRATKRHLKRYRFAKISKTQTNTDTCAPKEKKEKVNRKEGEAEEEKIAPASPAAAALTAIRSSITSPAPKGAASCPSGALSNQNDLFTAHIERLLANANEQGGNSSLDLSNIEKIKRIASAVGFGGVNEHLTYERLPSGAIKALNAAGLDKAAGEVSAQAAAEAAERRRQASLAASAAEINAQAAGGAMHISKFVSKPRDKNFGRPAA